MIYEKLPVVLLSTLASEKQNSTNKAIADYILTHREEASSLGIKELSEKCHVGTGTVSRFCREIGLEDFSELKQILADASFRFETIDDPASWNTHVSDALSMVVHSVDSRQIQHLCNDIHAYEKVSAYGMLKAEAAAIDLQVDLLMMGKKIETCVSYAEQMERILSAKNELILIFSYTGSYFDYPNLRGKQDALKQSRIWMICSKGSNVPDFVNEAIVFDSLHDQLSHPYQLEACESLIVQEYARMKNR